MWPVSVASFISAFVFVGLAALMIGDYLKIQPKTFWNWLQIITLFALFFIAILSFLFLGALFGYSYLVDPTTAW